jgi:exopolysaccharide production protein ExoZ
MGKLRNIQALRFLAALSVVLFHCTYIFYDTLVIQRPLGWLHFTGIAGVDVFFVISGFIIFTVSERLDWSAPPSLVAAEFLTRRLARVYPIYWFYFLIFTTLTALGVAAAFQSGWNLDDWPINFLLLNRYNKQVPVAWTLVYEIFFYLCFSIALLFGRRNYRVALAVWLAAEVVITAANHVMPVSLLWGPWRWQVWSNPLVLEFAIGCLVGLIVQRGHIGYRALAGLLAIPFFMAGAYWASTHTAEGFGADDYRVITFGIGAGLLVYSLSALEIAGDLTAPSWMVRLGDASYSLYLCQALPLFTVRYVLDRLDLVQVLWGVPAVLLAITATILLSLVSYLLAERPMVTWLQAAISRYGRSLLRVSVVPVLASPCIEEQNRSRMP